jgi:hypothetical protein
MGSGTVSVRGTIRRSMVVKNVMPIVVALAVGALVFLQFRSGGR